MVADITREALRIRAAFIVFVEVPRDARPFVAVEVLSAEEGRVVALGADATSRDASMIAVRENRTVAVELAIVTVDAGLSRLR